jgi:hypothetical protein
MHIIVALVFLTFALIGGVTILTTANSRPTVATCSSSDC